MPDKLKLITAVTTLFFGLSATAEIRNLYTIRGGQVIANEPDFTKSITDKTAEVDNLKLAKINIDIIIIPEDSNASFDNGHNINISRSMGFSNHLGTDFAYKTTSDIINVYAHEYGHAVFDKYISAALPEYAEVKQLFNQMSDLELKPYQSQLTPEQVKAIRDQYKALYDSLKTKPELVRVLSLSLAYHEVFADTVAVFTADSKGAISEALYNPLARPYDKYARIMWEGRDFGAKHDLDTWEIDEEHLLFSPLRSQIGLDECWPKSESDKSHKLKFLAKILTDQMKKKNAEKTKATIPDNRELIDQYKTICN